MALPQAKRRYTPAEYYALEYKAAYKSDYYDGEIFDMSGGTSTHSRIITNLIGSVWARLRGKDCIAYESNMRVKVKSTGLRTYPDLSVYCEALEYDSEDPKNTTALNPTVIVEVLSPSTEAYDRGLKATNYRQISTLMAYALVSQDRPHVELHLRQPGKNWEIVDVDGTQSTVRFEAIEIEVPLTEIYDRVDFASNGPST